MDTEPANSSWKEKDEPHLLLFSGHMIDQPDRDEPRFPPGKEKDAREAIRNVIHVKKEKMHGIPLLGLAGGACGGDILFHEVCEELNIPTELYMPFSREKFIEHSVAFADKNWIARFERLFEKLPKKFLPDKTRLPNGLHLKPESSIWERNNLWMLNESFKYGGAHMTLIVLWDGQESDGPGGPAI